MMKNIFFLNMECPILFKPLRNELFDLNNELHHLKSRVQKSDIDVTRMFHTLHTIIKDYFYMPLSHIWLIVLINYVPNVQGCPGNTVCEIRDRTVDTGKSLKKKF